MYEESYDPYDRKYAKTVVANNGFCTGHPITKYYCGARCHDCPWGGCACFVDHCCCPDPQKEAAREKKRQKNKKAHERCNKRKQIRLLQGLLLGS